MIYQDALDLLDSKSSSVIKPGLERVRGLLESLGNPQHNFKSVLIGGTNGKGSVAAIMDSILREARYKVGVYTSPHIFSVRERLVVGGHAIGKRSFSFLIEKVFRSPKSRDATYFEILTAMAFLHFSRKKVDIAVVEVGLGGTYDATNLLEPLASVVTSVDLDHCDWLGKDKESIARDKAGIARKNKPFLGFSRDPVVRNILRISAKRTGAQWIDVYQKTRLMPSKPDSGMTFCFDKLHFRNFQIPLKGKHQLDNLRTALATLGSLPITVPKASVRKGLKKVKLIGRLQRISNRPLMLVDAGHNPAAMEALSKYIRTETGIPKKNRALIFAASRDKDIQSMLALLLSHFTKIYFPACDNPRLKAPEELEALALTLGHRSHAGDSMQDCISEARQWAGGQGLVCMTGSFLWLNEIPGNLSKP